MNQQQKKFVINRINCVRDAAVRALVKEDSAMLNNYNAAAVVTIQDVLADDRAMLNTLKVREGISLDQIVTHMSLRSFFQMDAIQEANAERKGFFSPDCGSYTKYVRYVTTPKDSDQVRYQITLDKIKTIDEELQAAELEIMLGDDDSAKLLVQEFTRKFG
jgi:regulatory protein YycH of two-component signal transduction system YycFG